MKYYIIFVIILYIIYYYYEKYEDYITSMHTRMLDKDGFCTLYNRDYLETEDEPCLKLKQDVMKKLPSGYIFIDYVYKIRNVALSTFHRDVTSSKHIYNTEYPVYTLILYKYEGELLSVCPSSNMSYPFCWSHIVNIKGSVGTAFLFDSDLLHAGCINNCKERNVIQYKLCHQNDYNKLSHLHNTYTEKEDICNLSLYNTVARKASYYFEFYINYIFYHFITKKEDDNTIIGKIQSYIPIKFYNNT